MKKLKTKKPRANRRTRAERKKSPGRAALAPVGTIERRPPTEEGSRKEHRLAWIDFHCGQAERLRRTMTTLVEKHEAAAAQLLEGTQGEGTS